MSIIGANHLAGPLLLDLSLDQANRPKWRIWLSPVLHPVEPDFLTGEALLLVQQQGCVVSYEAQPEERGYQTAGDWWDQARGRAVSERLTDQIRQRLAQP